MSKPDFQKLARAIAKRHANRTDEDGDGNIVEISASEDDLTTDIAEQLRQVWNARGEADLAQFKADYDEDETTYEDVIRKVDC